MQNNYQITYHRFRQSPGARSAHRLVSWQVHTPHCGDSVLESVFY